MRRLSFIITILGIFILISLIIFQKPIEVLSPLDISDLTDNIKVSTSGKVIEEKPYNSFTLLKLDNNLELECSCPQNQRFLNKNISVLGIKNSFNKKNRIKVLRIQIIVKELNN